VSTPDTTTYGEQSVRSFTSWTPGHIEAARAMADGGSLRLAADLCEALLGDGRVQGVLASRVKGMLGLDLSFEESGDGRSAGRVGKAIEDDFWTAFPEADLTQLVNWGVLLGVGLGELLWTEANGRVIPRLKVWHPRWLRWDWQSREWRLAVDGGSEITITPGDGKWVIFTPYGSNRPWSLGTWRACAKPWLMKDLAFDDWARFSEVHGNPIRVGIAPENANDELLKKVAASITKIAGKSSIALPKGYDLKLAEAVSRSWETFKAEIDAANVEIAVAIAGQNLTSEVKEGSRAAATVHNSVKHDIIESDAKATSTCLHDQALTWWAEFNFGSPALAPWPKWNTEPPEDDKAVAETEKTRAEGLEKLAAAIAAMRAQGIEPDVKALCQQYGVPVTSIGPAPKTAPLRAQLAAALAALPPASLLEGQAYCDELAAAGIETAQPVVQFAVDALKNAIESATSYEDLRSKVVEIYGDSDDAELAGVLARFGMLARLNGRYRVMQD
jgi:phage gp29-like protein